MNRKIELKNWNFSINSLNFSEKISLPHTWNVSENKEAQLYRGEVTYKTSFALNEKINAAKLYFGAAYNSAKVYVNDNFVAKHEYSGYTPFELNVARYLKGGENTVKVLVNNLPREDLLPNRDNYDWADDGGLIRNVVLFIYDDNDIKNIKTAYDIESIKDELCSGKINITADGYSGNAKVILADSKTKETVLTKCVNFEKTVSLKFDNLKLWDSENPNLYTLTVKGDNNELSKRIGFRTVKVSKNKVYLNGKEIYFKACEWMPGSNPNCGMAEPFEESVKFLKLLKNSGCNFTRFHWQQDTKIFDWCDENGLLVQEEIPYWGSPKEAGELQLEIAKKQADDMVYYHGEHPSIVCWGVGNELGGGEKSTISYVDKMYKYFKSIDPSRLVNYVSNTLGLDENVNNDDAALHGDIVMWNEYLGLWQPCEDIEGTVLRTDKKSGGKPFMVTEFGLCEPYFKGGDERRTKILKSRIEIYKKCKNMIGFVWFCLNDYRTHIGESGEGKLKARIHGSTDLCGNPKPSYTVFKEIDVSKL